MNSSYKITLLVTIVLCGLVLGYYITQDDQSQPPKVNDSTANTADVADATAPSNNNPDTSRTTLRNSTATNTPPTPSAHNTTPPPAANTSASSSAGTLLDRVNARAQGSNDPIAPPPAATIPTAANTNYNTSTTPVTSDARSITPDNAAPSARTTANNNQQPRTTPSIPDTGRAALRTSEPTTGRTYTIKSGDTLSSIAEKTLGSTARWNDIAEANPYLDPRKLKPGQTIRLPDPSNASSTSSSSASSNSRPSTPAGPLEYVVREGDTLSRIARVHYSDPNLWEVIYRANKAVIGKDPAGIRPGMKLFIPPEPSAAH